MSTMNTSTTATGFPDSIEASLLLIAEAVQKINKERKPRSKEDRNDIANVLALLCLLVLVVAFLIHKGFDDLCNKMDQKDKGNNDKLNIDGGKDRTRRNFTALRLDLNIKNECSGGHACSARHHGHYYVPPYAVPPEYQPRRQTTPQHDDTY